MIVSMHICGEIFSTQNVLNKGIILAVNSIGNAGVTLFILISGFLVFLLMYENCLIYLLLHVFILFCHLLFIHYIFMSIFICWIKFLLHFLLLAVCTGL